MTVNMYIASFAWLSIVIGFYYRSHRNTHVAFMLTGIGIDIALVAYLQITRSAVQTALELSLKPLEQLHIVSSTIALLLYFPLLYLGFRLWQTNLGASQVRQWHKRIAIPALVFRTLGFILMFSMIK